MNINITLFGQLVSFAVFVWFCMKYIWPPLTSAMEERQQKMASGLQNAEKASQELATAQQQADSTLKEAKQQAAELIEQANKRANQLIDEAKDQAREEGERLKAAAQSEIEQEINRAKEELRGQVAGLAVSGAEKILRSSVDASAHSKMLEQLATEL